MSKKEFPQTKEDIKQDTVAPLEKNELDLEEVDLTDLIRKQEAEIKDAEANRSDFVAKQNKWFRQRYGLRKKATFPWYNSSSQHLPLQDSHVRKLKPEYVAVAWNTAPACELSVSPISSQEAITEEQNKTNEVISEAASWYFDSLIRTKMDIFEDLVLMTDKMLHKGFCIVKTIYSKEIEPKIVTIFKEDLIKDVKKLLINPLDISLISDPVRITDLIPLIARLYDFNLEDNNDMEKVTNICLEIYKGTDIISFTVQDVIYDAPKLVVLDPEEIIVPGDTESVFDLEEARWICYQRYFTPQEVLKNSRTGVWDSEVCNSILEKCGIYNEDLVDSKYKTTGPIMKDTTMLQQKRQREGVNYNSSSNDKNILIKEVCMWYDSDGDGLEERHILEYAEGGVKALRFIKYPYTSLKAWPYVKVIFELADKRHYSNRGTVEIEEPLATALNVQHNMKINRQTIASTPTLIYAANKVNPNNFQYIPGQAVPVSSEGGLQNNVQWFMPPSTDQTFVQEENILKMWSEEILAANDYGVQRASQGKPTATEVNYNASSRVGIRQLDIQIFQKALKEIYKRCFLLELQFSKGINFVYTDADGTQKVMDKATLNKDYAFQPMGNFGSSNPQLSAQISQRMFEIFKDDPMTDKYEVYREFISKQGDARLAKRILKSKQQLAQEAQQAQQMQLQMAAQGQGQPNQEQPKQDMRGMQQIKGNGPRKF